ncbi:MAG: T9SS type A sorting domain-containing protein [bacterium]|nr:T9SS type A sorting domain-containing protein [bacterium]
MKAVLLLVIAAASGGHLWAAQHTVTVQNFSFDPANLSIAHGDTVIWQCTSGFHNVHHLGTPSLFGNTAASSPWTYMFAFSDIGDSVFHYDCEIHPAMMQGTVTVLPLSAPEPRTPASGTSHSLGQNYPNPFNPTTSLVFDLSEPGHARLAVFNVLGEQVAVLAEGEFTAGRHEFAFDGTGLASGVYIYRLETNGRVAEKKMVMMK